MAEFKLDPEEREKMRAWVKTHGAEHHGGETPYAGAIGGNYNYVVTYTGLGMIVNMYCGTCQRGILGGGAKGETCLTNFDDW
ncbi:MAG: hypothetical protein ACREMO_07025 [Gemmatimonadales bacterium]